LSGLKPDFLGKNSGYDMVAPWSNNSEKKVSKGVVLKSGRLFHLPSGVGSQKKKIKEEQRRKSGIVSRAKTLLKLQS